MLREVLLGLAGLFLLAYNLEYFVAQRDDPREPRRLSPSIPVPIIGHVLGFFRHGFGYYNYLSETTDAEIYTVGILNFKVYISNSTRITQLAQKAKSLTFTPLLKTHNKIHAQISDESDKIFDGDLLENFSHSTKATLAPGPALNAQNLRMGNQALLELKTLLKQGEVELLAWAKHAVVQATAAGLYGVEHPLKDPEIEQAMWTWDEHRPGHMVGVDIWGTGYKARTKVWKAFRQYFENMPDDVSLLVAERQRILLSGGFTADEIARMQSTLSDAAYPNTVPTLFWTVYEIFSRPQLLEDVRAEVFNKAVRKSESGFELDVSALKTECHTLLSAYQETQRVRHYQVGFRAITEDTFLDGYLLKKGGYLQIPAKPTHYNSDIWGSEASEFDPYRFVPSKSGEKKTKILPSNFQPWGMAPHMCPGRQFASTEILIIAALLACRADLTPVGGKGWIRDPVLRSMEIPSLPRPQTDPRLVVTEREEGKGEWSIKMGDSMTRVSLASG
ncbi:cytochrome P450 [Aspergillus karnatakaensis]|uniref:cytochrome P450 n=1 Tax=Aspergillus karnatakaensis TaxID=1810916 RepID=UPI003CCDCD07